MQWLLGAAGLLLVLITPVRITVKIRTGTPLRWQVQAALWGIALPPVTGPGQRKSAPPPGKSRFRGLGKQLTLSLLGPGRSRSPIAKHLHVELASIEGRLSMDNAAAAALLSGSLNSLSALLPPGWRRPLRVRVLPDFTGRPTCFQFCGIAACHLGTLLAAAAQMWFSSLRRRGKKEESA